MRDIVLRMEKLLDKSGFEYCSNSGCFDVAAVKGKSMFVFKILSNVDSVQEEQAQSLGTISIELGGRAFIVGEKTRKGYLEDGIAYQRFDVPTVSMATIEDIFSCGYKPTIARDRGGYFAEIDPEMLRKKRKQAGMSQEELAEQAGTTKKCIYEHERCAKKADKALAERLDKILGSVSVPISMCAKAKSSNAPKGDFEGFVSRHFQSVGFETSSVSLAPFNIIVKESGMTALIEAEEKKERIEKMIDSMVGFSNVLRRPIIAVTKSNAELEVPTIQEKDLKSYTAKDLRKLAKA